MGNDTFAPRTRLVLVVAFAINRAPLLKVINPLGVVFAAARRFSVPPLFTVKALVGLNAGVTVLSVPP